MSISTSRHHADWLSLVEVSGPFVSLPVLLKAFPQGLEPRDPAQAKALRVAYDAWQDNPAAPGRQRAWVLHVLTAALGYPAELIVDGQTLPAGLEARMAEMGETLRPDFALVGPSGNGNAGQAQLLIATYPAEQALDHPVIGRHWKASPATRMTELLHAAGVPLGLVTNGEQWMLVFASRGETTGYASWHGALWLDEAITLRAFHSLLGVRRFFGVAADSTLLGLLKESAQDQQEVTDQLGYQVREAVAVLVQALDTLDQDSKRSLLKGVSAAALYEAALTVMMRLVFLFSAEERGLLHLGKPLYDDNYAVSTLLEQLQEVADLHGPQVLERRFDAWARLLATFRAVHAGVHHQDLLMPAYGGSLFDPDRYPFLEGRGMGTGWAATQARPLAVNNRVALHLLASLQRLRIRVPGGGPSESRHVSFRALGVEQIGHVYEGLLDHTAVRATETVLGVKGTRDKESEIRLTTLEAKLTQGQGTLIDFLKDETGRSASATKNAMEEDSSDEHNLLIACRQDKELLQRVRPFIGLIREDSFERPLVVLPGSVYVTAGTARRSTGTHYTPPSLTEPIVQYTLEPLVYQGPAEGLSREQWQLKPPKDILDLKVCDMAMGSGAFLVQACRYLAERLTEAWENEEKRHPNEVLVTPEGGFSEGLPSERLVPQDLTERLAIARRIVADRCLYGVDINPMAVEMAKLSLWLTTLDAKRPFTFLDHSFKCGDSLLGLGNFKQIETFSLRAGGGIQTAFTNMNLWQNIDEAKQKREALEAMPSDTPEQIAAKVSLYAEAEDAVAKLKAAADVLVAVELKGLSGRAYDAEREAATTTMMAYWQRGAEELRGHADKLLNSRRTLHWPLAFPEVMEHDGFDAFVGNPPFVGGQKITGNLGTDYRELLILAVANGKKGSADLCAYFFLRVAQLLHESGMTGLLATNTIAQGDTREVGLDQLAAHGITIYRANRSEKWPGQANLEVAHVWMRKDSWHDTFVLDGKDASGITPALTLPGKITGKPRRLRANAGKCFKGSEVGGMDAFVITWDLVDVLTSGDRNAHDILRPFLGYEDLVANETQRTERWCIYLSDWPLARAQYYRTCLQYVRDRVGQSPRTDWWRFRRPTTNLYRAIAENKRVLVIGETSEAVSPIFVNNGQVFTKTLIVFAAESSSALAIIASSLHYVWVLNHGSTLETRAKYIISDCFETFPFPHHLSLLEMAGERYQAKRAAIMLARHIGLTKVSNLFHESTCQAADIRDLRDLYIALDRAVASAYGWNDLALHHGFHETKQGVRYTISQAARREVLDRLLALNHQRHAAEEAERMNFAAQPKPTTKRGRKPRSEDVTTSVALLDLGGSENE